MNSAERNLNQSLPFDIIKSAFVMFEQNQDTDGTSATMNSQVWQCRKALSNDAVLFVHYTDEHAAGIYEPFTYCQTCGNPLNPCPDHPSDRRDTANNEADWWQWFRKIGGTGILYQDDRENNDDVADRISDFTLRFGTQINGWPYAIFELFERGTESKFKGQRDVTYWNALNNNVLGRTYPGMQPNGYCSGR
jgi:hypothetical protein